MMKTVAKAILVMCFVVVVSVLAGCRKTEPAGVADMENNGKNSEAAEFKIDVNVENGDRTSVAPKLPEEKTEVPKAEKKLWAKSFLGQKAPAFFVEKWLTEEPKTEGKFQLIEFWATWCGPCRKTIPELNGFAEKFKDKLTVIGISDEDPAKVAEFIKDKVNYHIACDQSAKMKKALEVKGIPHAIVVNPQGIVVWEGFPLLGDFELTADVISGLLDADGK